MKDSVTRTSFLDLKEGYFRTRRRTIPNRSYGCEKDRQVTERREISQRRAGAGEKKKTSLFSNM